MYKKYYNFDSELYNLLEEHIIITNYNKEED